MSEPVEMPESFDPYGDKRVYHFAYKMNQNGGVWPLCSARPREVKLGRECWTFVPQNVTCKKCLKKMAAVK